MKEVADRLREIAAQLESGELSPVLAGASLSAIARRVGGMGTTPELPPDYTHYHYSQPVYIEGPQAEEGVEAVLRRP